VTSRRRGLCVVVCALLAGGCGTAAPDHPPQVLAVTVRTGGLVPQTATGVATGGDRVLTVAHVLTGGHAVAVGGRPARIVRLDRRLDLAVPEQSLLLLKATGAVPHSGGRSPSAVPW